MLKGTTQLVVVTTPGWNSVDGTLQRYERSSAEAPWQKVGEDVPIVVGRSGLGWGSGLHGTASEYAESADPLKKEGDGRAPAGVFRLSSAFGFAPRRSVEQTSLPYTHVTPSLECVDDPNSRYYNRLVERMSVDVDWKSSEHMRTFDKLYKFGIVVDYNSTPVMPAAGSCVFLHVWEGPSQPTAGCTAMPETNIVALLAWLKPEKAPTLVQLPLSKLEQYGSKWGLPPRH